MNRVAIPLLLALSRGVLFASEAAVRYAEAPAVAGDSIPQTLRSQGLRPLSLAAADFDGDGVADLAAGFATAAGRGLVVLYRGNVDALYPHSPEARQRRESGRFVAEPFLSTDRVLVLTAPPDFLHAGDFDADGHADLAAAAAGGPSIEFIPGDGKGGFGEPRVRGLHGTLTALASGDLGLRDGLPDLVAAVDGAVGPRAVILQGASGALSGVSATVRLERAASAIAIGPFSASPGHRVAFLGEDGRVAFLERQPRSGWRRSEAETREQIDAASAALAPRRAEGLPADAPAVLAARVQADGASGEVVLGSDGSLSIHAAAVMATFVVDVATDLADTAPGNGVCADVNGDCSLRAAIQESNASAGSDTITFAIPGPNIPSISTPGLPAVTGTLTIDGTTQAAGRVEITGTTNGTLLNLTADACVVRGIVLNGTGSFALRIQSNGNVIEGNYFGTTPDGTAIEGGIFISNIFIAGGTGNRIGGTVPAARNVLAGGSLGIRMDGGSGTLIQGNYIGTDAGGTADLGASTHGVRTLTSAVDGMIGGAAPGAGNLISGNGGHGIHLDTPGFVIQGNLIGLDANGALALGNSTAGISLNFNGDTQIGGTAPGMGNVISGNVTHGIDIEQNQPHDIVVQGNRIGTDFQGLFAVPNQGYGIRIVGGSESTIGGPSAGAGNLISGNLLGGIFLTKFITVNATNNVIQGNLIGTDITGTVAVGNVGSGITFEWALGTLVGGAGVGEGNVISGNQEYGVRMDGITDASSDPNLVIGNLIGTNVYGTGPLGNGQAGVFFPRSVPGYELGGSAPGEMNWIAFNGGPGIGSVAGRFIHFRPNLVYSNGGLGVDRGNDGPTPNQPPGTFVWENAPILTAAATSPAGTSVSGTLASGYAATFTIHVFANPTCDPSGYGEARHYLGSTTVATTAGVPTPFAATLPVAAPADSYITALAVAPEATYSGAASELSFCRQVTGDPGPPDPVPLSLFIVSPAQGGNGGSVTLTVTGEGIAVGASIKLTRSGEPDVLGEFTHVGEGGGNLRSIFNIGGIEPGLWDIVVTNPDTSSATLPAAFTIEEGGRPDVWVDVIGRSRILRGRETKFYLIYGNRGNVDAFFVPVWLTGIPLDATINLKFDFIPQPQLPGLPPTDYASISPILDTPSDRRVPILAPVVPAGQTRILLITIKTQQPTFTLGAMIGEPWVESIAGIPLSAPGGFEITQDFASDLTDCLATLIKTVFSEILDQLLPLDCVDLVGNVLASQLPNFFGNMLDASQASSGSDAEAFALVQSGTQVAQIAVTGAKCLADVGGAAFPPLLIAKAALDVLSEIEKYTEVILKCGPLIRDLIKHVIETVFPSDPNDKIGAHGSSAQRWVNGLEAARYEILFENKPQATAPAHEVVVTDQLDGSRFDLGTFAFGPISFHDFAIDTPAAAGATEFTKDVDMRPARNVIVRVSGSLDPTSGLLTWHFHSLDPATGLPSEDPDQGFLPPNVNAPEGEGTLSFTVALQDGLPTGTEYRNRATIVFDSEAPILTAEWINTIDVTPPTSQVGPLPGTSCSAIPLLWSGADAHSGIKSYDIHVSEDGGPWTLHFPRSTATSQPFVGQPGHAYAFFSVARDAAGNEETAPASADASTNAANPSPVVDLLEPPSGAAAGGSSVALSGDGFLAGLSLSVGGTSATGVSVTDPQAASATFPSLAPGALHDVTATNTGGCGWTFPKAWFADFLDVDQAHPFHRFVENILRKNVTAGCAIAGNYCPANPVTRAQMAVFLLKSKYGATHVPPPATGVFGDVPAANPFAPWIEQLATELITAGCSGGNYCPNSPVTRAQMAVFLLKSKYGPNLVPPPASGDFADVPVSSPFAPWIEMLADEQITGGCGGNNYCPDNPVTRGQMAVFISKTFGY